MRFSTGTIFFKIFSQPRYSGGAVVLSFLMFSLVMWLPNLSVILTIWRSDTAAFFDKLHILWSLYGSLTTDFTVLAAAYVLLLSTLFGVHIAVLAYYIATKRRLTAGYSQAETVGFLGMFSGALGIGCAACGSLVLASLLSTIGAGGLLALLPLAGGEFGVMGVLLLLYSIHRLLRSLAAPPVC